VRSKAFPGIMALFFATVIGIAAIPSPANADPITVDGFQVTYLPHDISAPPTPFAYEWGGVRFQSQVWESGNDQQGWKTDLTISVLRGVRLSTPAGLNAFWKKYTDGDSRPWRPRPVKVNGKPGFRSGDRIVWLDKAGVAPTVSLDDSRLGANELAPTAAGLREIRD
jgi:hypothetical protein